MAPFLVHIPKVLLCYWNWKCFHGNTPPTCKQWR